MNSPDRLRYSLLTQEADKIEARFPQTQWLEGAREYAKRVRESSDKLPLDESLENRLIAGILIVRAVGRQRLLNKLKT